MFAQDDLTCDDFLGGALRVWQPKSGYRAGVDPVLLAASVPARAGQNVLELGCGVGVASLCLARRVTDLRLTGVEVQADYAALAQQNANDNGVTMQVVEADLAALPDGLRQMRFDHVIANPPYYERSRGTAAPDIGREIALAGATPLATWVEVAARRITPKGYLSMIQDIRRLPELLGCVGQHLGSIEVLPLSARLGRAPGLALLRARKGGKADFVQHFPTVMHEGPRHERDGESYSTEFRAILRDGRALKFPDK